jgi:hypothetical protein
MGGGGGGLLSVSVNVNTLYDNRFAHLAPDDESPEALLGRRRGDDQAQPHGEEDPQRDGGGSQPARHAQPRVHARHPVRPAAETIAPQDSGHM